MGKTRISPFIAKIISDSASARKIKWATKRRKIHSNEVIIKKRKTDGPLELKDLNEDCLIDIFSYLSKEDLVNIVEYDKDNFRNAARIVFRKKFGKQLIKARNGDKEDLKLLTHFGDLIENLLIYYDEFRRYKRLDKAILAKCSKSLVRLHIINANPFIFAKITEPFVNVKEVSFCFGTPSDLVMDLNKWFPNATSLEMHFLKTKHWTNYKSFIKHYPSLEHFGVSSFGRLSLDSSDLEQFARLNPQLKSLKSSDFQSYTYIWDLLISNNFTFRTKKH